MRKRAVLILAIAVGLLGVGLAPIGAGPVAPTKLVVAIPNDPTSLDAHWQIDVQGAVLFPLIYDKLVRFDMQTEIVPELATRWGVTSDGLTWTFRIRRGQKFHDGSPVNADAVVQNFQRLMDPKNQFERRVKYENIVSITKQDEYAVAFRLKAPDPFLLNLLADPTSSIVSPTAAARLGLQGFARQPVGSGPYVFKEWVQGSRVVFEKNPDHWAANKTNVGTIEFKIIPESVSRAIALEADESDFVTYLDPQEGRRLQANPNVTTFNSPGSTVIAILFNHTKPVFQDVRVRRAINSAIDREAMIKSVLFGYAKVADAPISPGTWPYKPQPPVKYEPERARRLLAEAGHARGLQANLVVPVGRIAGSRQVGEVVAEMLRKVGVTVTLDQMEHTAWRFRMRSGPSRATWDLSIFLWTALTGEANYAMRVTMHSENWAPECCNWSYYKNTRLDALLDTAVTTRSDKERREAYEKAEELVWSELPWVFLYFPSSADAAKKNVKGIQILPTGTYYLREVALEPR